jgi:hypothetical protein
MTDSQMKHRWCHCCRQSMNEPWSRMFCGAGVKSSVAQIKSAENRTHFQSPGHKPLILERHTYGTCTCTTSKTTGLSSRQGVLEVVGCGSCHDDSSQAPVGWLWHQHYHTGPYLLRMQLTSPDTVRYVPELVCASRITPSSVPMAGELDYCTCVRTVGPLSRIGRARAVAFGCNLIYPCVAWSFGLGYHVNPEQHLQQ